MTTKIEFDHLTICVDCASLIANGEVSDGAEDVTAEHAAKVDARWARYELVLSGSEDFEPYFSWRPCDGCGSTLGGDRFEAVAFGRPAHELMRRLGYVPDGSGLPRAYVFAGK